MKQRGTLISRITEEIRRTGQPLPGVPIVEITGSRRVLIENHRGVREYEQDRIRIAVSFGCICIEGSCLEICRMSLHQLIICGTIERVSLEGCVK